MSNGDELHDHDHSEHEHEHEGHEGHDHGHEVPVLEPEEHRAQGVTLFNLVWEMLDLPDRTPAQDDQMIHAAHASRWHWSQAGEYVGGEQLAIGEWQCSRVYSVLGRGEPAVHHARAALAICEASGLGDWVLAAAYEALARASAVAGDAPAAYAWLGKARTALSTIGDPEDRKVIEDDLVSIVIDVGAPAAT